MTPLLFLWSCFLFVFGGSILLAGLEVHDGKQNWVSCLGIF